MTYITQNAREAELYAGYPAHGRHAGVKVLGQLSVEHTEACQTDAAAHVEDHDREQDDPVLARFRTLACIAAR